MEVEKFDWLKAWYPVAIERDLPTDRPTSVRLLGNAIVLWKDGYGQWRAFKDACPHRYSYSFKHLALQLVCRQRSTLSDLECVPYQLC